MIVIALICVGFGLADQEWLIERSNIQRVRMGKEPYVPSPAGLVIHRLMWFSMAAALVFGGLYIQHSMDEADRPPALWTSAELRHAVTSAAPELGTAVVMSGEDMTTDHSTDIETAVDTAVSGDAPEYHVHASQTGGSGNQYRITADGTDASFCMSVYKTDPSDAPGMGTGTSVDMKYYTLKGRVKSGGC